MLVDTAQQRRYKARLERLWVENLRRNGADEATIQEHLVRQAWYEKLAAAAEAKLTISKLNQS